MQIKSPMESLKLSVSESLSPAAQVLQTTLIAELAFLRTLNDNVTSEVQTATIRGRIAEVKRVLNVFSDNVNSLS